MRTSRSYRAIASVVAVCLVGALTAGVSGTLVASPAAAAGPWMETTGGDAHTWTNYTNAGGTEGPLIPGFTTVAIACKVHGFVVADGNDWWYLVAQAPWSSTYFVSADAFYNNGQTSGDLHGTPFVDLAVADCDDGTGVAETTGGPASTWTDYSSAGGTQGQTVGSNATVRIECKVTGFRVPDGNTWWYRIRSVPWSSQFYVSADAFYNNGQTSGSLVGTPFVDPAVPDCPAPAPPPAGHEISGGAAHTWTNYQNAGGTEGQMIFGHTTVAVGCKVTGFPVPDGNVWWYQLTDPPWNGTYYVTADAFYNGADPSGSLTGTPFVDAAIPNCATGLRPGDEITGGVADTFGNYSHAGAKGPSSIPDHATVSVTCRVTGFAVADGNTWWYRIASPPWNDVYYASADAFYNGADPGGPIKGTPFVDRNIPICGDHREVPLWGTSLGSGRAAPGYNGCRTADPVDCASGDFWHSWTDTSIPGRGPALEVERTYNDERAAIAGLFGYGWSSSLDEKLTLNVADGSVSANLSDGSLFTAQPDGAGGFTVPDFADSTVVHNGDGTYTVTRQSTTTSTFDAAGRLVSRRDLNGYQTTFGYSGAGLASVTDTDGRALRVTIGANGDVASVSDPMNRVTRYTYDAAGNLTSVIDPMGVTTRFTYDGAHQLLTMTDGRGGVVTNTYDATGRTTSQTDPLGRATVYAYTGDNFSSLGGTTTVTDPRGVKEVKQYANGLLMKDTKAAGTPNEAVWTFTYDAETFGVTSTTDPNGHVATNTYDARGRLLTATDALGHTTSHAYNGLGLEVSTTDPLGVSTTHTYDARGNLVSTSTPVGAGAQTVSFAHADAARPGDVTSVTDPLGAVSTQAFDAHGDLASTTDALGHTTTATYNADGQRVSSTTARGKTTTFAYNGRGDLIKTLDPLGHATSSTYDNNHNVVTTTDAGGRVTGYAYDPLNRLLKTTRPGNAIEQQSYDENGNVVSATDAGNFRTTFTYDELNRKSSTTDPLGRRTTFTYDRAGNALTTGDAAGRTATNGYDAADRLVSTMYSDAATPAVNYVYDAAGRRTSMTDGSGTTTYQRDSLGRLLSSTNGAGATVGSTYDLAGRRTKLTYPTGQAVNQSFDAVGNLTSVTDWLGRTSTFTYDADNHELTQTVGSTPSVTDTWAYDAAGQVTSISMSRPTQLILSYGYTRTATGMTASVQRRNVPVETYTYDNRDELVGDAQGAYAYNLRGGVTALPATPNLVYNAAGRLVQAGPSGATTSYTWSPTGERLTSTPTGSPTTTYGYDQAHRLTAISRSGTSIGTYAYDGDGLRAAKIVGGVTTRFVWDLAGELPLLLTDGTNSFVYGPGGLPLEQLSSTSTLWYHHDQTGSTTLLTNMAAGTVSSVVYGSYGDAKVTYGSLVPQLAFGGQYRDSESGLYYLRARYYDPTTAQFLTLDPEVATTHEPYGYAKNAPLDNGDPTGRLSFGSNPFIPWLPVSFSYRDYLKMGAVPPYAAYYVTYRTQGSVGRHLPGWANGGMTQFEWWMLNVDGWFDDRKHESPNDEATYGGILPFHVPGIDGPGDPLYWWLPGIGPDGRRDVGPNNYGWGAGFGRQGSVGGGGGGGGESTRRC